MHVAPPEDRLEPSFRREAPVVSEHRSELCVDASLDHVRSRVPYASAPLRPVREREREQRLFPYELVERVRLALRSLSWVYRLLPSFSVNSRKKLSRRERHRACSASHKAAPSASLVFKRRLAIA